jgi:DNA-binding beta-propeller fold protein YncE
MPSLDQAMALVPTGLASPTSADYSFGTAVATNGELYFTEFSKQRIRKYNPASDTMTTVVANRPGLFGVAVDTAGNIFYAQDFGINNSRVVWRTPGGSEQDIITGMTAPK